METGDFEQNVMIRTKDELAELGNSFNRMTAGLKRLQELKDEFVFIAAHELRAQVFRASLVSNPLGQPVRFDTDTPAVPQSKR